MFNFVDKVANKEFGMFVAGVAAATAGLRILTSSDAKKVYTHATAVALRGREEAMTAAAILRENCEDIYADAVELNNKRAASAAEEVIEDAVHA